MLVRSISRLYRSERISQSAARPAGNPVVRSTGWRGSGDRNSRDSSFEEEGGLNDGEIETSDGSRRSSRSKFTPAASTTVATTLAASVRGPVYDNAWQKKVNMAKIHHLNTVLQSYMTSSKFETPISVHVKQYCRRGSAVLKGIEPWLRLMSVGVVRNLSEEEAERVKKMDRVALKKAISRYISGSGVRHRSPESRQIPAESGQRPAKTRHDKFDVDFERGRVNEDVYSKDRNSGSFQQSSSGKGFSRLPVRSASFNASPWDKCRVGRDYYEAVHRNSRMIVDAVNKGGVLRGNGETWVKYNTDVDVEGKASGSSPAKLDNSPTRYGSSHSRLDSLRSSNCRLVNPVVDEFLTQLTSPDETRTTYSHFASLKDRDADFRQLKMSGCSPSPVRETESAFFISVDELNERPCVAELLSSGKILKLPAKHAFAAEFVSGTEFSSPEIGQLEEGLEEVRTAQGSKMRKRLQPRSNQIWLDLGGNPAMSSLIVTRLLHANTRRDDPNRVEQPGNETIPMSKALRQENGNSLRVFLRTQLHRGGTMRTLREARTSQSIIPFSDLSDTHVPKTRFDSIILAVPNSESADIRLNPEKKILFSSEKIDKWNEVQTAKIDSAVSRLKSTGSVYYLTHSLFQEENQRMVDLMVEKYRLIVDRWMFAVPRPSNGYAGVFIAKLKRRPKKEKDTAITRPT